MKWWIRGRINTQPLLIMGLIGLRIKICYNNGIEKKERHHIRVLILEKGKENVQRFMLMIRMIFISSWNITSIIIIIAIISAGVFWTVMLDMTKMHVARRHNVYQAPIITVKCIIRGLMAFAQCFLTCVLFVFPFSFCKKMGKKNAGSGFCFVRYILHELVMWHLGWQCWSVVSRYVHFGLDWRMFPTIGWIGTNEISTDICSNQRSNLSDFVVFTSSATTRLTSFGFQWYIFPAIGWIALQIFLVPRRWTLMTMAIWHIFFWHHQQVKAFTHSLK